jgi:hypothetical protein
MQGSTTSRRYLVVFAAAALLMGLPQSGLGAPTTITIDAFDGGCLGWDGVSPTSDTAAYVGPYWVSEDDNPPDASPPWPDYADIEYHNYHKFDLSFVSNGIVSAELILEFPTDAFQSRFTTELIAFVDVTSDPDDFGFDFESGVARPFSMSVYEDLEEGSYGFVWVSESDEDSLLTIGLDSDAASDINDALGGTFCIGGYMSRAGHGQVLIEDVPAEWVFANTGSVETDPRFGLPYTR